MTDTRPPAPGDDMRALLTAGGRFTGRLNVQAAVHLLTFTDLPAWPGFRDLVHVEQVDDQATEETYDAAFVNWAELAGMKSAHISGSTRRLLELAASMAIGEPVNLRESLSGFGHAGKRRIMEAVAIATDAAEFCTLTWGTPEEFTAAASALRAETQGGPR